MASPKFEMRLSAEDRARWVAAADADGTTLAMFVRACVEEELAARAIGVQRPKPIIRVSSSEVDAARVPHPTFKPQLDDLAAKFRPDFKPGAKRG